MSQASAEVIEELSFQFGSTPAADAGVEVDHAVASLGDQFAGLLAVGEQAVLDAVGVVLEAFDDGQFSVSGGKADGGVEIVPVASGLGEHRLSPKRRTVDRRYLAGGNADQNTNKQASSSVHSPYSGG